MGIVVKIDGHDGTGKTTLVRAIAGVLRHAGIRVCCTSEFGTSRIDDVCADEISQELSHIVLDSRASFDVIERQAIFLALALRQNRAVLPPLRRKFDVVVSDRSSLACYAYSVDVADEWHPVLDRLLAGKECMDLLYVLSLDAELAQERQARSFRQSASDAVEIQGIEFQRRVAAEYARRAELSSGILLDASSSIELLVEQVERRIRDVLSG